MYRIRIFLIVCLILLCEISSMIAERRVRMLEIRWVRRTNRWKKIGDWFSKRIGNLEKRLTKF